MNTKQFKKANDFFKVVRHPVAQKILSQIEKAKEPIPSDSSPRVKQTLTENGINRIRPYLS